MTTAEPNGLGGDVSDSGNDTIKLEEPYRVAVTVTGDAAILFHRWQSDSVEAKANAAKGSAAKKTDDVESYVWRDDNGHLCLPGEYLRGTLIDPRNGAAKYRQDPRSPRKSALDLFRAGIVSLTDLGVITRADGSKADDLGLPGPASGHRAAQRRHPRAPGAQRGLVGRDPVHGHHPAVHRPADAEPGPG